MVDQEVQSIYVVVVAANRPRVQFRLNANEPLDKMFLAYADLMDKSTSQLEFYYHGLPLDPEETALVVGMRDGAFIEVIETDDGIL